MATVIDAIENLVRNPVTLLGREYRSRNRANGMGEALEEYVKDLFAGTFGASDIERLDAFERTFSYLGNNSNPPDAMLRGGDAIEVKKIEALDATLALNSSYPKHTLRADSPMISEACRDAEDWDEKDILYVVGSVFNGRLRHLAMVYGLDYCASGLALPARMGHGARDAARGGASVRVGRLRTRNPRAGRVHPLKARNFRGCAGAEDGFRRGIAVGLRPRPRRNRPDRACAWACACPRARPRGGAAVWAVGCPRLRRLRVRRDALCAEGCERIHGLHGFTRIGGVLESARIGTELNS